ncbi:hypothetical protein OIU79_001196 [Salix purpurea]|uniref:Uncharacterized protein n=1 Tax=Salix purpurea TaxID=77065 RepID=A0A9Q0V335_SALPP|nr:hypothetical protein OIU79_001196 [Salix purpurea]
MPCLWKGKVLHIYYLASSVCLSPRFLIPIPLLMNPISSFHFFSPQTKGLSLFSSKRGIMTWWKKILNGNGFCYICYKWKCRFFSLLGQLLFEIHSRCCRQR